MDIQRELSESVEVAKQLTTVLAEQGKQITHSSEESHQTHLIATDAQKTSRTMSSWGYRTWYWIRDTVTSWVGTIRSDPKVTLSPEPTQDSEHTVTAIGPDQSPQLESKQTAVTQSTASSDTTQQLLHQLTEISLQIGTTLDHQNQELADMESTNDQTQHKLKEVDRRSQDLM